MTSEPGDLLGIDTVGPTVIGRRFLCAENTDCSVNLGLYCGFLFFVVSFAEVKRRKIIFYKLQGEMRNVSKRSWGKCRILQISPNC